MKKLFANWKLNLSLKESSLYMEEFLSKVEKKDLENFIFFMNFSKLVYLSSHFKNQINFGAQNVFHELKGAFSGQESINTLMELNLKYTLVGHSEAREIFHLTENQIHQILSLCQEKNITPILCLGEKEKKDWKENLLRQLKVLKDSSDFYLAYEPIWAIGGKKAADKTHLVEVFSFLKDFFEKEQKKPIVLYGGSVHEENIQELCKIPHIDGFLVGSKSLKVHDFLNLFKKIKSCKK